MKLGRLFLAAFTISILLASCNDSNNEDAPLGVYDNGILVLNEGNATAGSITYIGDDMTTTQQNVYGAENNGDGIGGYVQSIFFDGDKAFIISNGSNMITVVNRYTFKRIAKITGSFDVPRYGAVVNGKAYVTNIGHDFGNLTDDFISVIDLSTYEITGTIALNMPGERITEINGKIYVANGSYGAGHSVTVINPSNNAIVKTIDTGIAPNSFEEKNGDLYVLCANYADASRLVKIDLGSNEVIGSVTMDANLVNAQNLDIEGNKAYFTVGNKVYSPALSATAITDTPLFESGAMTLYGFAVKEGRLYVSDATDYNSDGKVFIYSATGTLQNQFTVGLIPNGFYFND